MFKEFINWFLAAGLTILIPLVIVAVVRFVLPILKGILDKLVQGEAKKLVLAAAKRFKELAATDNVQANLKKLEYAVAQLIDKYTFLTRDQAEDIIEAVFTELKSVKLVN